MAPKRVNRKQNFANSKSKKNQSLQSGLAKIKAVASTPRGRFDLQGFKGRAIDIPLFRRQLKNIGINLTKNEANAVYSLYDKDGNGQLEYHEFLKGFFSDHLPVYEQAASAQPSMAQHFATIESYEHAQSPLSHQQQQYQQYPSYTQHHYLEPNNMHAANNVSQSSWSAGPYSSDASINFQHQSNNVVLPPPPISHSEEADFDYSGDLSESFLKPLEFD